MYTYTRLINHIRRIEIPNHTITGSDEKLRLMRIKYMIGDYTEKKWQTQLITLERRIERFRDIRGVLHFLTQGMVDVLLRVDKKDSGIGCSCALKEFAHFSGDVFPDCEKCCQLKDNAVILTEIPTLIQYAEKCLLEIKSRYGCITPSLRRMGFGDIQWIFQAS